jgi:hypothetical protein
MQHLLVPWVRDCHTADAPFFEPPNSNLPLDLVGRAIPNARNTLHHLVIKSHDSTHYIPI